ncbi:phage tail tape measure protein, TP901 family [Gottschalkia purinilytica]|uniref:Phage tail tape measure protein, TP901 family n=1 Tax=Gottschalkia purinilytica TaxID=1503 RepID=A0A0L0WD07_GOTPU|nr:phage tail tape measure protein [Gottschalkia purinilytica]KNF09300.1 phage tail tape measure protein, TP901 family [Gottschalkia purinilytica]
MSDELVVKAKAEVDSAGVKTGIDKATTEVDKFQSKLENSFKKMSDMGDNLTKKITVPLMALGGIAVKSFMDFEEGLAKTSTLFGDVNVDMNKHKKTVLDMSKTYGIANTEINEAFYQALSAGIPATRDMGTATKFMGEMAKLAKGGFTQLDTAVDATTSVLNAYNLETDKANKIANILIKTQNYGKTTVDELGKSLAQVVPIASNLGVSFEQVGASISALTAQGIKTPEAMTRMRALLDEVSKGGTKLSATFKKVSKKTFVDFIKSGGDVQQAMQLLKDHSDKTGKSFGDMFSSSEAKIAALSLTSEKGASVFKKSFKDMQGDADALTDAFNKMDNTSKASWTRFLEKLKKVAIQLGESLMPSVEKVLDGIGKLVDGFSNLPQPVKDSIVQFGLLAMATGPVIKTIGKVGSTVTSLTGKLAGGKGLTSLLGNTAKALGATGASSSIASGALGGLASSALGAVGAVAPFVPVVAGVGIAGHQVYKALTEKTNPALDLFADKTEHTTERVKLANGQVAEYTKVTTTTISEETKKQLGAFMELSMGASQLLTDMYASQQLATDENITALTGKFTQMKDTIIGKYEEQKNGMIQKTTEAFVGMKSITAEEQQSLLESLNSYYTEKIKRVNENEKGIEKILQEVRRNKGQITLQQYQELQNLQSNYESQAIQMLSRNKAEQEVILNNLKSTKGKITDEMLSNAVKKINEEKNKTLEVAKKERDEKIRIASEIKETLGKEGEETAQKMIDEANRQYTEVKDKAEQTKKEGIDRLASAYSGLRETIDVETGQILSFWSKLKKACREVADELSKYEGISNVPSHGSLPNPSKSSSSANRKRTGPQERANGTPFFTGGATWVHERGPELINLPRGTQIIPNSLSKYMMNSYGKQLAKNTQKSSSRPIEYHIHNPKENTTYENMKKFEQMQRRLALNI